MEISYKDTKYSFDVERLAEDQFKFTINGESFVSEVREQPDGALLASAPRRRELRVLSLRGCVGEDSSAGLLAFVDAKLRDAARAAGQRRDMARRRMRTCMAEAAP